MMHLNDLPFLKDAQHFRHKPLSTSLFTWRADGKNSACVQDSGSSNKMEAFRAYLLIRPTIRRSERPALFHSAALPNSLGPPQPHRRLNSANPWPPNRHIHPHALSQELIFILRGLAGTRARKKREKKRKQEPERLCLPVCSGGHSPLNLSHPSAIHNSDLSAAH